MLLYDSVLSWERGGSPGVGVRLFNARWWNWAKTPYITKKKNRTMDVVIIITLKGLWRQRGAEGSRGKYVGWCVERRYISRRDDGEGWQRADGRRCIRSLQSYSDSAPTHYIIVHRLAGSRVAQPYLPLAPRPATCTLIKLALFIRLRRRRRRPFEKQYIIYIIYMYTHYYYRYTTQLKLGRRTRFPPSSLTRL